MTAPRSMTEVQSDYNATCARLGELHYCSGLMEREMAELESRLAGLNEEAKARKILDTPQETA